MRKGVKKNDSFCIKNTDTKIQMFNIETYLDSLPENIKEINVSNKGITSLDVTRFKNLKILNCNFNNLTSLHLNENLQTLLCSNNQLTYLHLNENLQELSCNSNKLTSLQLNENLQILWCGNNQLTYLHLNKKLQELVCNNNQLTYLHLNEILEYLNCQNNQITSFRLNEKLNIIRYNNNPICEIIGYTVALKQLNILNKFRYLYYSLKFKKRLRDILWVKIREPKIRVKYSHDYLVEHLREETDLDELLENW